MIYCILGKTGSGKTSAIKKLKDIININEITPYTTRPKRDDETDGIEYNFIKNKEFDELKEYNKLASYKEYIVSGGYRWQYGFKKKDIGLYDDCILITNPYEHKQLKTKYGNEILTIFIDADLEVRTQRCMNREDISKDAEKINEIIRRLTKDEIDYSNIKADFVINNDGNLFETANYIKKIIVDKLSSTIPKGKLIFHTGVMKAGKSAGLIDFIEYQTQNKILVLKPSRDDRDVNYIRSRNGKKVPCTTIFKDTNLQDFIKKDVYKNIKKIFIDEVQFLSMPQINDLYEIKRNTNIEIHCFGLLITHQNTLFKSSEELLKIADEIIKIPYICDFCKKDYATHQLLNINGEYVKTYNPFRIKIKNNMFQSVCYDCYRKVEE